MKALLTDLTVRALAPAPKQMKVWDTKTKGFGVLVSGSTKTFFASYGRERRIRHSEDTLMCHSRTHARKRLVVLAAEPAPIASNVKFADAVDEFIEDNYRESKRAHEDNTRRLLVRHFVPTLGKKVVAANHRQGHQRRTC